MSSCLLLDACGPRSIGFYFVIIQRTSFYITPSNKLGLLAKLFTPGKSVRDRGTNSLTPEYRSYVGEDLPCKSVHQLTIPDAMSRDLCYRVYIPSLSVLWAQVWRGFKYFYHHYLSRFPLSRLNPKGLMLATSLMK